MLSGYPLWQKIACLIAMPIYFLAMIPFATVMMLFWVIYKVSGNNRMGAKDFFRMSLSGFSAIEFIARRI